MNTYTDAYSQSISMSADTTFPSLCQKISALSAAKDHLIIAIDGRCTSGKTTLAAQLKEAFQCNVIPMDHFFLQPHMRTKERLATPGGNVDYERFLEEVLLPLHEGTAFSYRPFNCHIQLPGTDAPHQFTAGFEAPITVKPASITIIEGSYSCHPALYDYYDYRIFLTTSYENQLERIRLRNGADALPAFIRKWIPLEELYFKEMDVQNKCDLCITT